MVTFPHCKINLGLQVISRRPDGFHNIETCFYPIAWNDILEILPSQEAKLDITGLRIAGESTENLCWKAYQLIKKDFDLPPVHIHLHKLLPSGAGLGGGSSDAAFTLRTINEIFQLHLSPEKLVAYASSLGSDCTFFLQDSPMMGTGRGEVIDPINVKLKGKYLILLKPDIHVSTSDAYAGVKPREPLRSVRAIVETELEKWRESLANDFEESVFRKFPQLGELKNRLYQVGAVYASMSGSGSSVFGIFDHPVDMKSEFAGMTYWSGELMY
jgi:4-diphosphocytidyl-2-C-methyl-D-erythritol kinase